MLVLALRNASLYLLDFFLDRVFLSFLLLLLFAVERNYLFSIVYRRFIEGFRS